jgi:hypothetical protein
MFVRYVNVYHKIQSLTGSDLAGNHPCDHAEGKNWSKNH